MRIIDVKPRPTVKSLRDRNGMKRRPASIKKWESYNNKYKLATKLTVGDKYKY